MIGYVDNMLRHILIRDVDELNDESQVRFQPPGTDWSTYVTNLTVNGAPALALNVYLTDIRENAQLKTNQRTTRIVDGVSYETLAPRRIDCHYFISAWSPASITGSLEPTIDEHELLYDTTHALMRAGALHPPSVYSPNPLPAGFPSAISDSSLPMAVVPEDGFGRLPEFWGAMSQIWRPGVYLIITLPVVRLPKATGPLVTTQITRFRPSDTIGTFDTVIAIGGSVLDSTLLDTEGNPTPMIGVQVILSNALGDRLEEIVSNEEGQFLFGGLTNADYTITARLTGRGEVSRTITVPASDGNYDISFT